MKWTLVVVTLMLSFAATQSFAAQETSDFKFLPRAEDFATVFKGLESLSSPGWDVTAAKVVDIGDQTADSSTTSVTEKMPVLKEFNCNEYLNKTYSNAQDKITLELCRFDNSSGAYGAYTYFREGASTVVRRGDGSSEDDDSISFWENRYLILLRSSGQNSDECKDLMRQIADQVEKSIANHAPVPPILSELPFMDRVSGSEHVFMGPLGGRKFSPVHLTNDLILSNCIIGATSDYQIAEPFEERLKVMLIAYKDPTSAIAACKQLVNDVCPSCGVPQPDTPTIFKLSGRYAWCQVRGAKLGVVTNGRRAGAVALFGHQLNW